MARAPITVDVDDALLFIAKLLERGAGQLRGHPRRRRPQNYNRIEINGTRGSLVWNFERHERARVLQLDDEPRAQGFRTIMCHERRRPPLRPAATGPTVTSSATSTPSPTPSTTSWWH